MKKTIPFLQKGLATLFVLFCLNFTFAQLTVTENPPDSMTVCNGNYTFELVLTTGSTAVDHVNLMPIIPSGVSYTGNLSINATELVNDPNMPIFEVALIPANSTMTVTYTAKADCSIIPPNYTDTLAPQFINVQDTLNINYFTNAGSFPHSISNQTTSYNLLYTKLNIAVQETGNFSNALLGDIYNQFTSNKRMIRIQNGGIGATDTVIIRITPEPEIDYTNGGFFAVGSSTSLLWSVDSFGDIIITLSGTALQSVLFQNSGNQQLMDFDDEIRIYEDFEVVACSPTDIQNEYQVLWGCNSQFCNENYTNAQASSNVAISANQPEIVMYKGTDPAVNIANYCGEDGYLEFLYVNEGDAPGGWAKNLNLAFSYDLSGVVVVSDFSINGMPVIDGYNGIRINDTVMSSNCSGVDNHLGVHFDFSQATAQIGEMGDFDSDNFYDDLAPGDTMRIRYKVHIKDSSEYFDLCDHDIILHWGIPKAWYQSQCDSFYCAPSSNTPRYEYFMYGGSENTYAPSDIVQGEPETFTFCTNNWQSSVNIMTCSIDSFYLGIHIPTGYQLAGTGNPIWVAQFSGDTTALTAVGIGNDIFVNEGGHDPIYPTDRFYWNGCYSVDLEVICEPTLGESSTITWEMDYVCDTCNFVQQRACGSAVVYNHTNCNSSSCPAIETDYFNLDRNSFGWTDYTQTVRVTADSSGIDLKAAYPCDSLISHVGGTVIDTGFQQAFVAYTYDGNTSLLTSLTGTFYIYNSSGILQNTCVPTPPNVTFNGVSTTITFEMPNPCFSGLNVGDSIVFVDDFKVGMTGILNDEFIPNLRAKYFVIDDGDSITCSSWGENFTLYDPQTVFLMNYPQHVNCDVKTFELIARYYNAHLKEDFPNEFRNSYRLNDTIRIIVPPSYTALSNYIKEYFYNTTPSGTNILTLDHIDSIAPYSISGDTLTFIHHWAVIDRVHSDALALSFDFVPNCEVLDNEKFKIDYNWIYRDYADDNDCKDTVYGTDFNDTTINFDAFNQIGIDFNKPNLTTSVIGSITAEGYQHNVSYLVRVCNDPNASTPSGTAYNVWFDFDNFITNDGNMIVDSVVEIPTLVSMPLTSYTQSGFSSAFVELDSIVSNQCRTFQVYVSYTNCQDNQIDTLRLLSGWNCGAYPTPSGADTSNCQIGENDLYLRYHAAYLDMVVTEPTGTFDICDTIPYEVLLVSSAPAFMYDVNFWLNLPANSSLLNPLYQYPASAGWLPLPSPTIVNDSAGWDLTNIIPALSALGEGIPGTQQPTLNSIRIMFSIISNCDVDPNDPLGINSFGITNCNDSVYHNFDSNLPIAGFENIDSLTIGIIAPDTIQCTETGVITVNITNDLNTATNPVDSVQVLLPVGITYVSGLSSPSLVNTGTGTLVTWLLNPPIPANGSTSFNITVQADDTSNCSTFSLPSSVFFGQSTPCGNTFCVARAMIDQDTTQTVICCSGCDISALFLSDTVCVGDSSCFDLLDLTTAGTGFSHQWDFGDGSTSTLAEPCHLYATDSTYTVTHIVTDLNTGCSDTATMTTLVNPYPEGVIEFLGCNPFCEGDSVYLHVIGVYDSIQWIDESLFPPAVISTDDTLIVTTSGVYNAILFIGECSDSCLAISLTSQPTPVINLPDTVLCSGDSVLMCAGGGYNFYEWTYNGFVINNGDSCIWVHDVGQYTVTVGQQLTFGCCLCTATDTFNVTPNSITVTLPDLTLCEGSTSVLCPTILGGTPAYSYLWSTSDTTGCIVVSDTGTYIVTVTDSHGCTDSDTATVDSRQLTVDVPDLTLCEGTSGTLCATVSDGTPSYSYSWTPTGQTTPCITVNVAGVYTVNVVDSLGCIGSDTGTVTIIPLVTADFTFEDTVCVDETTCFTATNSGVNEWIVTNESGQVVTTSTDSIFCYLFPSTGTYVVTHILTNAPCSGDTITDTITVVPPIEACIVMIGTNPFCVGDSVLLTVNDPFNQVTQVDWYLNGILIGSADTLYATQAGTYTALVHDNNGCTDSCMCIVLTQLPIETVTLPDELYICTGSSQTIDAGTGFSEYIWYLNGVAVGVGQTYTATSAGVYTVRVMSANGCYAYDSTLVILRDISPLVISSSGSVICVGETFFLSVLCDPNLTYSWERKQGPWVHLPAFGTGCTQAISSSQVFGSPAGTRFRVHIHDNLTGCDYYPEILIYKIPCLGLNLVPNPTHDGRITVMYDLKDKEIYVARIEIINIHGATVRTVPLDINNESQEIDLSGLANGVYFAKLIADGIVLANERFVIAQ